MRLAVASESDHLIVLQDDALPCRDFPLAVTALIEERPDSVLSLWVGGLRCKTTVDYMRAMTQGERWVPIFLRDIVHVVGLVWPRELAESLLDWTSEAKIPGWARNQQSDDAVVSAWARQRRHTVWACVPSLIEHSDEVPSTIGRRQGGRDRRAIYFLDTPVPTKP